MIAKNSSVHNSTLHIFSVERYVGGVITVLRYHPYLVSMLFADLLSLHLVTSLIFFYSRSCHFLQQMHA